MVLKIGILYKLKRLLAASLGPVPAHVEQIESPDTLWTQLESGTIVIPTERLSDDDRNFSYYTVVASDGRIVTLGAQNSPNEFYEFIVEV